jgi:putative glutamine amidotransferase
MKPLIGINCDINSGPPRVAQVQTNYSESILKAGGVPLFVPPMPPDNLGQMLAQLSGFLFIGGSDYCPSVYGEKLHPKSHLLDAERDDFDRLLMNEVLNKTNIPVLGICAGSQLLNIVLGGTLIQDIKSEFPDSSVQHSDNKDPAKNGHHKHEIVIEAGTILSGLYAQTRVAVPTSHHQAIRRVAGSLRVAALSLDGVIEAVEMPSRAFTIGVQWHPERDFDSNRGLFLEFIKEAMQFNSRSGANTKALTLPR